MDKKKNWHSGSTKVKFFPSHFEGRKKHSCREKGFIHNESFQTASIRGVRNRIICKQREYDIIGFIFLHVIVYIRETVKLLKKTDSLTILTVHWQWKSHAAFAYTTCCIAQLWSSNESTESPPPWRYYQQDSNFQVQGNRDASSFVLKYYGFLLTNIVNCCFYVCRLMTPGGISILSYSCASPEWNCCLYVPN